MHVAIAEGSRALCPNPAEDGRACSLCDGYEFTLLHQWDRGDRWNPASRPLAVWECMCGLVMLHPTPTSAELPDRGEWWSSARRGRNVRRRTWKKIRTRVARLLFGSATERLVRATQRAIPHGRLLDVGCGPGNLLRAAQSSYDCTGLDPSPIAAAHVRALGFDIIEGTIEEAVIKPGSFDVVTMDSVIEHVLHPRQVLGKVNQILAPGGIVALKTPKLGGPAYRMHGRGWNGFRHGYHTHLFTGETLTHTLELAGFEVLKSPRRNRPLDDVLILWGRKIRGIQAN